jgi:hypothetical protein
MPATRPFSEQSTQELAGHFLSGATEPVSDRTLELANGFGAPTSDPMDRFGSDMFPPITLITPTLAAAEPERVPPAGPGDRAGPAAVPLPTLDLPDDEPYESTQALDPRGYGAQPPDFAPDALDEEPYESTQALGSTDYSAPLPTLEPAFELAQAHDPFSLPAKPAAHQVTVDFAAAGADFDRTIEIDGGFLPRLPDAEDADGDLFPPLK